MIKRAELMAELEEAQIREEPLDIIIEYIDSIEKLVSNIEDLFNDIDINSIDNIKTAHEYIIEMKSKLY